MLGRLPCAGVRSSTSTGPTRGSQRARLPSPAESATSMIEGHSLTAGKARVQQDKLL